MEISSKVWHAVEDDQMANFSLSQFSQVDVWYFGQSSLIFNDFNLNLRFCNRRQIALTDISLF